MAQKRIKRTDQEWFDLIKDCKTSSLKVKIWCEQHGITAKAIDYHTRRLRQKGYTIPQRIPQTFPCEKQEIVCLDISKSLFTGQAFKRRPANPLPPFLTEKLSTLSLTTF